ncbi:transglycosylase SLT domain-containing protein [Vibrio vulnificus]|nr:transglycosylase SLT domain-containing protein [Vibrio vulnificus]
MDLPIDNQITSVDVAFYEMKATHDDAFRCVLRAARHYTIHPDYIYTILKQEAGTTGEYRQNESDGTHDIGDMQINYETWAREFRRLGYQVDWRRVLKNQCDNILVGTKIIKLRQSTAKDALTAMANYHWFSTASNKQPHLKYKSEILPKYRAILREKQVFISTLQLAKN